MRILAHVITALVRICERVAGLFFRIQQLLTGSLPALLPPKELTDLIRAHYARSYRDLAAGVSEIWCR